MEGAGRGVVLENAGIMRKGQGMDVDRVTEKPDMRRAGMARKRMPPATPSTQIGL